MSRTPAERRQRLGMLFFFIGIAMLIGALVVSQLPDPRALDPHPESAFAGVPSERLLTPFHLHVDPMERLLLVNLEGDPDSLYAGFEPQAFDDDVHGRGVIVIGWRHDGRVDVFHPPEVRLDPDTYGITGDGLHLMLERPLEDARFEITEGGIDLDLRFEDAIGRQVELRILETSARAVSRFGLLAPMGDAVSDPPALPLVLMREFAFVRLAGTEALVAIDGREHELDLLPVPIDFNRVYFVRYALEPLIATFNPEHDGPLEPLTIAGDDAEHRGVRFDLDRSASHTAVAGLERTQADQSVRIAFEPGFPNPLDLAPGADLEGRFVISSDMRLGRVVGEYRLQRLGERVHVRLVPSEGWRPRERKLPVRLVYRLNPVFLTWPSTYVWEAELDLRDPDAPTMVSSWRRQP